MKEVINVYADEDQLTIVTDDQYYYIDDGYTLTKYPDLESAMMAIIQD